MVFLRIHALKLNNTSTMATIFGIQFGSRFISTRKFEAALNKERDDFERFNKFEQSQLLSRYLELDELVHSGEFEKKVRELKTARFKDTEQFRQLDQYNTMRSASDIKTYLKFVKTGKSDRFKNIETSELFTEYQKLHAFVNSSEFHAEKVKKDFKKSDAFQQLKKYKELSKKSDIRFYHKTKKSGDYKTWLKTEDSDRLKTFFELEAIVQSEEFLQFKAFMEDKKRYKKSQEARLVEEFETLQKNEEIKWYLDKKKNDQFKEIRKWHLTFEDDFDSLRLDHSKWMTGYYWGKALMNETYVLAGENQFFRDENIEMRDSVVRITTRKEQTTGKTWDPVHGFMNKTFEFTSGLISTGQSFRQKHGKFEAKVRFSEAAPIVNAFWMVGEKMVPQIDVFKSSVQKGKVIECGIHSMNGNKEVQHQINTIKGATFKGDYYIYTLEWSPEAIIWKINGLEVNRITNNLPDEPMYLTFCTTLPQAPDERKVPATLEIDWVRCYQRI